MKFIYLVEQCEVKGYDTFDSFVVCAPDAKTARDTNPNGLPEPIVWPHKSFGSWATKKESVKVTKLGKASRKIKLGIQCASFNAG